MSSTALRSDSAWAGTESYGAISGRRYRDRDLGNDAIKILPGEFQVTSEDIVLVTLLGSCVSACLRDPLAGVGGIRSEEHTSELQSLMRISYAVFCLQKKKIKQSEHNTQASIANTV